MVNRVQLPDGSQKSQLTSPRHRRSRWPAEIGPGLAGKRRWPLKSMVTSWSASTMPCLPPGDVNSSSYAFSPARTRRTRTWCAPTLACAHVMARAVMRLFDGVQPGVWAHRRRCGFYYDFDLPEPLPLGRGLSPRSRQEMRQVSSRRTSRSNGIEEGARAGATGLSGLGTVNTRWNTSRTGLSGHEHNCPFIARESSWILCRGPHVPECRSHRCFQVAL